MKVELSEEQWTRLLNCAALAPYREAQPLIEAVVRQLQKQKQEQPETPEAD